VIAYCRQAKETATMRKMKKERKEIHCGLTHCVQHFIIQKEYFLITKLFPISLPSQCLFFFILLRSFMSRVAYNFFPAIPSMFFMIQS
jgi:hypothetical protein